MNNHHKLCYNDEWVDDSCELCQIINYVVSGLIPQCNCNHKEMNWVYHLGSCKYGAFMYSQDRNIQE